MNRVLLAKSLEERSPASSGFRDLIAASAKYGFTNGNYNSDQIELTELGEQLTKARSGGEKLDAIRQGFRKIPLFELMLNHFNNNRLPGVELLKGTLEREPYNVTPEWSQEAAQIFTKGGQRVGFVRDVNGSPWVVLDAGAPTVAGETPPVEAQPQPTQVHPQKPDAVVPTPVLQPAQAGVATSSVHALPKPQFFVGHGRNKTPVEQLRKILGELSIPYVIAEEEANAGRPISRKVRELMASCMGGIFIFSADEEFKDKGGTTTIFRPRENVIYELGAASYIYDQRIVIFKERDVTFPTGFSDLGYIEFDKDQLEAKSMELIRELIALGAVRLMPGP